MTRSEPGKALTADEVRRRVPRYLQQARQYELNVGPLLAAGEPGKAGEALWGAVASALKALALARNGRLLRAAEVDAYGGRVARDHRLREEFAAVRSLHANFYDQFLDAGDVRTAAEKGLRFLKVVAAQAQAPT